ncbi:MAG: hypothetical protein JWN44_4374 [Myxococcales bacterium]|nr:hypothetical protein [Myxococcales bacterium]
MGMRGFLGGVVMLAAAGSAAAKPGELMDTPHSDEAPLTILDSAAAQPCALKSGLCVVAGSRTTIAVASQPIASAVEAGTKPTPGKSPPVVPRFSRAASVASSDGPPPSDNSQPWTLEIGGPLKHSAYAGNTLFLFFDLEDPDALANRQFTALFQGPVKAGPRMSARVNLSPEEGFRAGHSYRIRIVQLIGGREIVLAEGDVSLL